MADADLIQQFAATCSEDAFAALVRQHVNLVFSTAMRQLGNRGLAEEVTQNVFIILSKKAGSLGGYPTLAGWLHRTTLLECRHRLRTELRRHRREEMVSQVTTDSLAGESLVAPLIPLLDEALIHLPERDRIAVTLRFLEDKSLREVGEILGVSEDTARKRVDKSLTLLTSFFRKRGFAIAALTATAPLFTQGAHAAPAGLAATITAAALKHGAGAASALTLIDKILLMTTAKKITIATGIVVLFMGIAALHHHLFLYFHHRRQMPDDLLSEASKPPISDGELKRLGDAKTAASAMMIYAENHGGQFPKSVEDLRSSFKKGAPSRLDWSRFEIVAPATVSGIAVPGKTVLIQEKETENGVRAMGFDGGYAETKKL